MAVFGLIIIHIKHTQLVTRPMSTTLLKGRLVADLLVVEMSEASNTNIDGFRISGRHRHCNKRLWESAYKLLQRARVEPGGQTSFIIFFY